MLGSDGQKDTVDQLVDCSTEWAGKGADDDTPGKRLSSRLSQRAGHKEYFGTWGACLSEDLSKISERQRVRAFLGSDTSCHRDNAAPQRLWKQTEERNLKVRLSCYRVPVRRTDDEVPIPLCDSYPLIDKRLPVRNVLDHSNGMYEVKDTILEWQLSGVRPHANHAVLEPAIVHESASQNGVDERSIEEDKLFEPSSEITYMSAKAAPVLKSDIVYEGGKPKIT